MRVGVTDDPCSHLEPAPELLTRRYFEMLEALQAGRPAPEPTPEAAELYETWRNERLLNDFGELCRYEAANVALAPPGPDRAVFFGDSLTEAWRLAAPALFDGEAVNRGISGQTTAQMLVRFRADVLDLQPRVVHIMAGTNDVAGNTGPTTLGRITGAIMSMAEQARAHGVGVILASVPPARFPWAPSIDPAGPIRALNAWLRDYAGREGLVFADYFPVLDDGSAALRPEFTTDGTHFTPQGYAAMAPVARAALEAVRRSRSPPARPGLRARLYSRLGIATGRVS